MSETLRRTIVMPERFRDAAALGNADAEYLQAQIDKARPITAAQDHKDVAWDIALAVKPDIDDVVALKKEGKDPDDVELLAAQADLERNARMIGVVARRALTPEQLTVDDARQKIANMRIRSESPKSPAPEVSLPEEARVVSPLEAAEFWIVQSDRTLDTSDLSNSTYDAAQKTYDEMTAVRDILKDAAKFPNTPVEQYLKHGISPRGRPYAPEDLQRALAHIGKDHSPLAEGVTFQSWKKSMQPQKPTKRQRPASEPQPKIEESRSEGGDQRPEMAQNQLIDEVIKKGGIRVSTDMPPRYSSSNTNGFSDNRNSKLNTDEALKWGTFFSAKRGETPGSIEARYAEQGIYEAFAFEPVMTNVYKESPASSGRKKLFGKDKGRSPGPVIVGTEQGLASDMVQGASEEPAVQLIYRTFNDMGTAPDSPANYRARDGRPGNYLAVGVILPESVAKKVENAAKADPRIIRKIVEGAVVEATGMPEGSWGVSGNREDKDKIIRPPYEARERAQGGKSKIYLHRPGDTGIDPSRVIEFKS